MLFSAVTLLVAMMVVVIGATETNHSYPIMKLQPRVIYGSFTTDEDLQLSWTSIKDPTISESTKLVHTNTSRIFYLPLPLVTCDALTILLKAEIVPASEGETPLVVYESVAKIPPDCLVFNMGTLTAHWRLVRVTPSGSISHTDQPIIAETNITVITNAVAATVPDRLQGICPLRLEPTPYESFMSSYEATCARFEKVVNGYWSGLQALRLQATRTADGIHARAEAVAANGSIQSLSDLQSVVNSFALTLLSSATVSVILILLRWAWWTAGNFCWPNCSVELSDPIPRPEGECDSYSISENGDIDFWKEGISSNNNASCWPRLQTPYSAFISMPVSSDADHPDPHCRNLSVQFDEAVGSSTESANDSKTMENTGTGRDMVALTDIGEKVTDESGLFSLLLKIDSFSAVRLRESQQEQQRRIDSLFYEEQQSETIQNISAPEENSWRKK